MLRGREGREWREGEGEGGGLEREMGLKDRPIGIPNSPILFVTRGHPDPGLSGLNLRTFIPKQKPHGLATAPNKLMNIQAYIYLYIYKNI